MVNNRKESGRGTGHEDCIFGLALAHRRILFLSFLHTTHVWSPFSVLSLTGTRIDCFIFSAKSGSCFHSDCGGGGFGIL